MKRARFVTMAMVVAVALLVSVVDGQCDDAMKKLGRGAINIVSCPLEFWNQIQRTTNEHGQFSGWTWGLIKGIFMIPVRAVVGAYEVVTFPLPVPEGYKPILTEPETFWN